ncbi:hypothetical protein AGMMS4956_06700 [Bacteroidia bacterium]|nr:hypothetical protein AGMMS4956_06700 [Bacteroidia bacterium]
MLVGGTTYYSDTVTIALPARTYNNNIYVSNTYCNSNTISAILNQPPSITFKVATTQPSCNTANLVVGNTANGTIKIFGITGGIGAYKYKIDNGSYNTDFPLNGIDGFSAQRTYNITVADAHGNASTVPITINAPAPITVDYSVTKQPSLWCGIDDTISVTASGGIGRLWYNKNLDNNWSTNNILSGYQHGAANFVYVQDSACIVSKSVTLTPPPALSVASKIETAPVCWGENNGKLSIVVANRIGVLSVETMPAGAAVIKSDVDTVIIGGLQAGADFCILRDTYNGQTCELRVVFTIHQKDSIKISPLVTPVSDKGSATGAVTVSVSGGNGGDYAVSLYKKDEPIALQSQTTASLAAFAGLGAAAYTIEAMDVRGCKNTMNVQVPEPTDTLRLQANITRPISCHGQSDAIVILATTGGWGDSQYSQDNFTWIANPVFMGFLAGNYTFYVKDKFGGTHTAALAIGEPAPLTIVRDTLSNVPCKSTPTGWVRYRISGGTYPDSLLSTIGAVFYSIENGDTLITVSGLPAGAYTFTVIDSRGCTATAADTITEPALLQLTAPTITHTSCELNNGALSAQALGGVAPYTYTLSQNGENIQTQTLGALSTVDFINLLTGQYKITVVDSKHCAAASEYLFINSYTNPAVKSVIVRPAACFGEANGRVEITDLHVGTTPVRTFKIDNGNGSYTESNTTGVFENLLANDYFLTVYDSLGCASNSPYPVRVHEPQALSLTIDAIHQVAEKSTRGGKIFFQIHGGNSGIKTVRLRNASGEVLDSISNINDFQALSRLNFAVYAGAYRLEVSDGKACQFITHLLQVQEPAQNLHLIITEVKDALCKSQTGSIAVQGAGGWGGYRYKRAAENDYADFNRFENLYPGNYLITVKDSMGATYSETLTVHEPQDSLQAKIITSLPPTCGNNGKLSVHVSGGTPPYQLYHGNDTLFASQPQTLDRQGLASGAIMLHLADANGCRFELEAALPDTALLNIERLEVKYPDFAGASNGAIAAQVKGGVAPYTYLWTGISQEIAGQVRNNNPANNLSTGYYLLSVSDAAGCFAKQQVYLAAPEDQLFSVVKIGHETSFAAANGYAVLQTNSALTDYEVITPAHSALAYTATDSNHYFFTKNDTVYLQNLASGNWFISGKTLAGQRVVVEFEIQHYPAFVFANSTIRAVSRRGSANGEIRVEVQGGGGDNRFRWTDTTGQIFVSVDNEYNSRLANIPAGKYTVQATDRYGNHLSQTLDVPEPAQDLQITIAQQKNQSCRTYRDAYVLLSASGGWGDYQFRHQNETFYNNASSYANLATGEQYFYLIDQLGSIDSVQASITEPAYLRSAVARVEGVRCKNGADGRIVFDITGGTAPYSLMDTAAGIWIAGNEATNLRSGFYTFVFTDSNACESQDTLTVYVPQPDSFLFKNIAVAHTTCNTDNGKITVAMQGGTRPYTYRWLDFNGDEIGNDSTIFDLQQNAVYRLEVSDANGCTQFMTQQIRPSTRPIVTHIATTDVLCYGDATGTARVTGVTFAEPAAPYALTWSNSDTGIYSNRFYKGQHYVSIADSNGCTTSRYFDIGQPDSLRLRFADIKNPHCFGYSDGYIHTATLGGVGNYAYLWSSGDTTSHIDSLSKGDYWVRVTDGNGCVYNKQMTLNEPNYQQIDLGEDVLMCPGNAITIDGQDYPAHRWYNFGGDISNERYLTVRDADNYFLETTDARGCAAWGALSVAIGNSALEADFLLSSDAAQGDTLILIELSNLPIDSLQWQYDSSIFTLLNVPNGYLLELLCKQTGMYNIGLHAYSSGCTSYAVKQVEIKDAQAISELDNVLGYKDPLIVNFIAYPNPNNGIFDVKIELREKADITLTLFSVASGTRITDLSDGSMDTYTKSFNLSNLNTGMYVLLLTVGKERKQIKLMINS